MPGGIQPPKSVVLTWPKPNYINPELRPAVMPPLAIVLNALLLIWCGIRLWIRYKIPKTSGWDDLFFVIAAPAIIALTVVTPIATDVHGYNRHIWDNPLPTNVLRRKYALALMTLFSFASNMLRISILLFYRRISSRFVSPVFRWTLWVTIGSGVITGTVFSLMPVFACQPISAFWDRVNVKKVQAGYTYKCFDEAADVLAASAISAVQDLLTALLPNLLLWQLQVQRKQKMMLVALFSLAYCATAMGFIRLAFNHYVYFGSYDVTWNAWNCWLLTMLELHVAAFCACAPAIKTFSAHHGICQRLWALTTTENSRVTGKASKGSYSSQDSKRARETINGEESGELALFEFSTPAQEPEINAPVKPARTKARRMPSNGSWLESPERSSGEGNNISFADLGREASTGADDYLVAVRKEWV